MGKKSRVQKVEWDPGWEPEEFSLTIRQKHVLKEINDHAVTFAIGPAGTTKTFCAVKAAVDALTQHKVKKILICRPAVEAQEKIGFLPGDLKDKVDPYLRPIYDTFDDLIGLQQLRRLQETGKLEIAALAYCRGRNFKSTFAILDEAQNCNIGQLKMFLTRLGQGSKMVVTGDLTQIDLPVKSQSGLITIQNILKNVTSVSFVELTQEDVMRHPVVKDIVVAYEMYENSREPKHSS